MIFQESGRKERRIGKPAPVLNYNLFRYRRAVLSLHGKVSAYAVSDRFFQEYELALCEYFEWRDIILGDDDFSEDLFQGEGEISRFLAWYSLYFITDEHKKTFPELFASLRRRKLSQLEREILDSYAHNPLGFYEVKKVVPGRGMYLRELFGGETRFVHDPPASRAVFTWDILFTGIVGARGLFFLSDFGMIVIPPRLKAIVEGGICSIYRTQRKNSKEIRQLLRYKSAEVFAFVQNVIEDYESFHVKNSEGDPLLFSTLHCKIEDPAAFLETVKKTSIFIQDHIEYSATGDLARADYIWVKRDRKKDLSWESATQGIIFVEGDRLRAKCNSRFRAEKLKAILAGVFGKTLSYECTVFEDQQFAPAEPQAPIFDEELLECGELRDVLKEILAKHYDKWTDERLPAIGNISPREAVKSPLGRLRVNDLLKELENRNERAVRKGSKTAGLLAFPVQRIREKLNLRD